MSESNTERATGTMKIDPEFQDRFKEIQAAASESMTPEAIISYNAPPSTSQSYQDGAHFAAAGMFQAATEAFSQAQEFGFEEVDILVTIHRALQLVAESAQNKGLVASVLAHSGEGGSVGEGSFFEQVANYAVDQQRLAIQEREQFFAKE